MPDPDEPELQTSSRFDDPDAAFRMLVEAHRGLSEDRAADLDARLVLILANHIGSLRVLHEAVALAACSLPPSDFSKD